MKAKLVEGKANAFLSKDLSQILLTAPLDTSLSSMEWKSVQWDLLKPLLETLEFRTLVKQWQPRWGASEDAGRAEGSVGSSNPGAFNARVPNVAARFSTSEVSAPAAALESTTPSKTEEELRDSVGDLKSGALAEVLAAAVSGKVFGLHQAPHELVLWSDGIYWNGSSMEALEALKPIDLSRINFMGFDLKNVFHDFFGERTFRTFGPQSWDHLLASYTLKAGDQLKFEEMVKAELGTEISGIPSPEEIVRSHLLLKATLEQKLRALDQLQICRDIEFSLVPVLFDMEEAGVLVDRANLLEQSKSLLEDIQILEKKITGLAGESFNIASPKQLAHILFEKFKLKPLRKTKSGYSTDADVLEALSAESPIAALVLDYRELTKLKSTYVDALPLLIDQKTGRIHTSYNQAITATGRLSSEDPNLQNIPIRTERGSRVRGAFIAPPGRVLISLDYGQIELRVLAEVTADEGLAKAFRENIDIHRATASEVFSVPATEVTDEQRRVAKAVNFGVAYGMGAFGLAESLKISRTEAQGIIDRYFKQFPGV
ncbi:MAG: DNA polymerase I, partial [Bdellovibrionales bacterium]|nr:DNA polymerase I [Bdellovibrionales bacterium]